MPIVETNQELPYNTLKKLGWAYLDKCVTNPVHTLLTDTLQLLVTESDADGQPELANEAFLYDRFKDNCANNMWYANWQILKYFSRILRIKVYKAMVGEWAFTTNDVEMYNYFSTVKVSSTTKCKSTAIKCRTMSEPDETILSSLYGWQDRVRITFAFNGSNGREQGVNPIYYSLFEPYFLSIIDMLRNCKGLSKIHRPINFFSCNYVEDYAKRFADELCRVAVLEGNRKKEEGEPLLTNVQLDLPIN